MTESRHLTPAEALADSRIMAARQLRKVARRPMYVVFLFVQPVILVLLFRYVFGGAIDTGSVSYVDFLMPGIIVQTAVFGRSSTGLGLTDGPQGRRGRPLRSLPIARSAVLVGRTAADVVKNVLTLIVMLRSASPSGSARPSRSMTSPSRSCSCSRSRTRSRGSARSSG